MSQEIGEFSIRFKRQKAKSHQPLTDNNDTGEEKDTRGQLPGERLLLALGIAARKREKAQSLMTFHAGKREKRETKTLRKKQKEVQIYIASAAKEARYEIEHCQRGRRSLKKRLL